LIRKATAHVVEPVPPLDDQTFDRRERVLKTYYERLNDLDKSVRELTSFFFGINTAVLALVVQVVKDDLQRAILAVVGYCVSITIYLITYKSFLSWKLYAQDMVEIEHDLNYNISLKYDKRLEETPGKTVRTTLVRMRFNFLFILLWVAIIGYLALKLFFAYHFSPAWLSIALWIVVTAAILFAPWVYFTGNARPGLMRSTLRALWATEV
jgi:hypothetical protein